MKKGMRQTEIGWIPEDWQYEEISNILHPVKKKFNPINSTEVKLCIELEHIESNSGRIIGMTSTRSTLSLKTVFQRGDILFGKLRPYLRKYALPDFDGVCTTEIWVFTSGNCHKPFCYYIVQSERFIEAANLSTGTKMPRAEWATVSKLKVAVPSADEQQAIADVLSAADAWIESLEALLHKKRLIRQGVMQELLRPKEGWEVKKLGEIGYFSKGKGISKSDALSGSIPAIRYGEIYTKHDNILRAFTSFIDEEVAKGAKRINKGDLLFAGSGETKAEIGKTVAFVGKEAAFAGGDIIILSPSCEYNSVFLGYLLNTPEIQTQKAINGQGDAVVHIYQSGLENIHISTPPLKEQIRIADLLKDIDFEIEGISNRLTKARQIKQGMIQQLLTGQIRLKKQPENKQVNTLQRAIA